MKARWRVGLFLSVTGLLILAASGYLWRGDASRRAEIRAERTALEDSAVRIHDELVKASLRSRAFQQSLPDMPDSVQRYGGRKYMDIGAGHNKTIRKLEMKERDVKLDLNALKRETERERAHSRATALPTAVAGLAATALGGVLMLISRRRVGA